MNQNRGCWKIKVRSEELRKNGDDRTNDAVVQQDQCAQEGNRTQGWKAEGEHEKRLWAGSRKQINFGKRAERRTRHEQICSMPEDGREEAIKERKSKEGGRMRNEMRPERGRAGSRKREAGTTKEDETKRR